MRNFIKKLKNIFSKNTDGPVQKKKGIMPILREAVKSSDLPLSQLNTEGFYVTINKDKLFVSYNNPCEWIVGTYADWDAEAVDDKEIVDRLKCYRSGVIEVTHAKSDCKFSQDRMDIIVKFDRLPTLEHHYYGKFERYELMHLMEKYFEHIGMRKLPDFHKEEVIHTTTYL